MAGGQLVARVKVYESGTWLNRNTTEYLAAESEAGVDPIFDSDQWEFWNGYFWGNDLQKAKPVSSEESYPFTCSVEFDPHRNKFIMVRTNVSNSYYTPDAWDGDVTSKVSILESDTPYGPFGNEKVLVDTAYDEDLTLATDCAIFGILKNKIILIVNFSKPLDVGGNDYNVSRYGYGSYFGSVTIT